ncbi:hypothetical protein [Candidatus Albibeggiatoa sp. nov. NOAA]|uniref:hypothetical protein n=1 Tax=Candidatus Albibeggiatoa sp. nov. NOAA TaxID=3162724 RepID=UPI00330044DB|nr:hypothetical protein [Thiotrichaceae bacterium]
MKKLIPNSLAFLAAITLSIGWSSAYAELWTLEEAAPINADNYPKIPDGVSIFSFTVTYDPSSYIRNNFSGGESFLVHVPLPPGVNGVQAAFQSNFADPLSGVGFHATTKPDFCPANVTAENPTPCGVGNFIYFDDGDGKRFEPVKGQASISIYDVGLENSVIQTETTGYLALYLQPGSTSRYDSSAIGFSISISADHFDLYEQWWCEKVGTCTSTGDTVTTDPTDSTTDNNTTTTDEPTTEPTDSTSDNTSTVDDTPTSIPVVTTEGTTWDFEEAVAPVASNYPEAPEGVNIHSFTVTYDPSAYIRRGFSGGESFLVHIPLPPGVNGVQAAFQSNFADPLSGMGFYSDTKPNFCPANATASNPAPCGTGDFVYFDDGNGKRFEPVKGQASISIYEQRLENNQIIQNETTGYLALYLQPGSTSRYDSSAIGFSMSIGDLELYKQWRCEKITKTCSPTTDNTTPETDTPNNNTTNGDSGNSTDTSERVIQIPDVLTSGDICTQQDCTFDVEINQPGFYVVSARLLNDNTEGFWGISFTTSGGVNTGGFNSGATLKENGDAPGFMAFYLSESETVNITPYEYTGSVNNITIQLSKQESTGERTVVFTEQTTSGTQHTTAVLEPGFYVAEALSSAGDARGQFGFSINASSMAGGVNIGGWIDSNTEGFGGLYVDSNQTVQVKSLFGDTYGTSGSGYMQIDVYQQQADGERVLYYSSDSSLF